MIYKILKLDLGSIRPNLNLYRSVWIRRRDESGFEFVCHRLVSGPQRLRSRVDRKLPPLPEIFVWNGVNRLARSLQGELAGAVVKVLPSGSELKVV